ncbi:MAG: phenylalanine--tRNA ligase subunit beta, partial [Bacteroidota bacterium]
AGSIKGGLTGVITGEVIECDKHPDADKLKVTRVNVGDETLQIVCGAPNVAVGQKVLVALVGTTIYPNDGEPLTLRKAKIRGIESHGMICAEDELGLGTSHDGILILPQDTEIGIPASNALTLDSDYILEIGLTPNRCDAMGHYGVARDIRAFLNHHHAKKLDLKHPDCSNMNSTWATSLSCIVQENTGCTAYYVASIKGVKITKDAAWISERLQSIGVSSINNVVDCANYVMHEFGTPLHAFDARHFTQALEVRQAFPGEELLTLDGITRKLTPQDTVIVGDGRVHCLAGVMGGKESGVNETTVDLLLESAVFNASMIRKSAKHHGIHSDASFRFERGVDPDFTLTALQRAVSLILETAGGTFEGMVEVHQVTPPETVIEMELGYINQILGSEIAEDAILNILTSLDILPAQTNHWKLPRYRHDVKRPVDVVEEVVRIAGFQSIPTPSKWSFSVPVKSEPYPHQFRQQLAERLASKGYSEILNNSLTKAHYSELELPKESGAAIVLQNPLSKDLSILRTSLLFGMLETLAYNRNRQAVNLKMFEFGQTYHAFSGKHSEKSMLGMALTGTFQSESWLGSRPFTFFDLKSQVIELIQSFGKVDLQEHIFQEEGAFQEGIHLHVKGKKIGTVGIVAAKWLKEFGLKQSVYAAQIDVKSLFDLVKQRTILFREMPKTFQVRRDFALVVDQSVRYDQLVSEAHKAASAKLFKCSLFDVYEGDKIEKGKKSYAIAFHFQDPLKTLTDLEIDADMEAIRIRLEQQLGALLR